MSIRDSYYFALLEVHNGRPISVKTCFKGQQGDLTTLSRTVCRCQKQPDGSLRPEYGFDDEENANCFIDPLTPRERLIILGGGHIAQPLCEFAAKCDFSVTVVDDRMALRMRSISCTSPPTILLWLSPAATGTMPTACGHCSSSGSLPISA